MIGLAVLGMLAGLLLMYQAGYESAHDIHDTLARELLPWMVPMIVGGAIFGNSLYILDNLA